MKITDVSIDKFGVWQDLSLPVHPRGITVIHGPNEAGKSTLMRFIRGVLYDFSASGMTERDARERRLGWGGSLTATHQGQPYQISRRIDEQGKSQFSCKTGNQSLSSRQFEEQLLRVDADVFQSIYTLGLKELRELATLQTEQVSEYIYGSSLGVVGQRLLAAESRVRQRSLQYAKPGQKEGQLFELSGKYNSLQQALSRTEQVMARYRQTLQERQRLEEKQRERRRKLESSQRERTGLQYLMRVWTPWKRQRELNQELLRYNDLVNFPKDGLRQLENLERQQESVERKLKSERSELQRLKKQLEIDRKHYELRDHASGMRALIDLKGLVENTERHLAAVSADASMLKAEVDEKLLALGKGWTIQKLDSVDTSPDAHLQLIHAAKNYQTALSRRNRHRKKYKKVSDTNHNRQTEWQEKLRKKGIDSLEKAIRQAQQRLHDLEQLTPLQIQESEYEQRIRSAQTLLQKYREGSEIPWWASFMLTLFAVGGGFLIIAGLLKGIQTSWLIGGIFVLTGIMGSSLSWALRQHYETDETYTHSKLEREISDCQRKLNEVRDHISRITGTSYNVRSAYKNPQYQSVYKGSSSSPAYRDSPSQPAYKTSLSQPAYKTSLSQRNQQQSGTELIQQATQKLSELEGLARTQEQILKVRKKLSVQRGKLAVNQRDVSAKRQAWCDLLKRLGLQETIRTNEAFHNWQQAVDAMQSVTKWKSAREDVQRQTEMLAMFREQMEQIAGRMNLGGRNHHSLTQVLTDWQKLLDQYERIRVTYLQQQQQCRDLKRQIELTKKDLQQRQADIRQLLRQGGAETVEDFRLNAGRLQRIGEIRALLTDLADQMNSLGREQPELAIVEEDLVRMQPQQTQERIDLIQLEIEELEQQIVKSQEELGRLTQTLSTLESDTTTVDLEARSQRVLDESRLAMQDWLAATQASETLARMTSTFEQRFQPETLARASHYLQKLTCGRYEQVRTPFGSRDLFVHEANGSKRASNQLSDGTREQLFLAIRLALVDILAEDRIELPMVLDDICVNFDQERTEAAVDTILEFAERRQVLFFTCHRHLASLFQERGIDPTWLPSQGVYEPQRLAG